MTKHVATYQWGHKRPGWTFTPAHHVHKGNWSNTLWRRSKIRVVTGWLLYAALILGLAWAVASVA